MKKVLSLAACSALVLGFAATASAVHVEAPAETSAVVAKGGLVTIDGSVRHRGYTRTTEVNDANASGNKADDGSTNAYDTRVRLGVTAQTSDAITGRILLENGSGSGDTDTWGIDTAANPNALTTGGDKKNSLEILEAWIQYQPANYGVKVGHMPLALGNNLFFDHTGSGDDAIIGYMNPTDATHVAGLIIKFVEGNAGLDQDEIDGYVALATHKVSDALKLGANYTYLHIGAANGPVMAGGITESAGFSNLGLTVDGKIGGFTYGLDGEFQFGEVNMDSNGDNSLDDAGGMAIQGTLGMDLNGVALGALIGYGTGEEVTATPDNDIDAFINFLTDTRYQSTMVGYIHAVPDGSAAPSKNTGLSNLTIVQLNAAGKTTCPMTGKALSLKARANYLQLTEEVVMNGDDDLGFELEGFADWTLGNGLVYGIEAAYLWAGDGWDLTPNNGIDETEDGYYLRHRLELKF